MARFSDLRLMDFGHTIQIAGAVYAGDGKILIVPFPDERLEGPMETVEMASDDWLALMRQTDQLETEVLARAADGSVTKAILRKCQRQIDQAVSWRVYRRDGYRCAYCSADDVPLTVDHLVRWEEGGPSVDANLLSACRRCNRTRGDMSYADWLQSPYYRRVSARLTPERRAANEAILGTLDAIPRKLHVHSR